MAEKDATSFDRDVCGKLLDTLTKGIIQIITYIKMEGSPRHKHWPAALFRPPDQFGPVHFIFH